MMTPVLYSLRMTCRYKQELRALVKNPSLQISTVHALNLQDLKQDGIEALVLDFDGVLVAHGETVVLPEIQVWLKQALKIFGENKIFILSNLHKPERAEYFEKYLPDIVWIEARHNKPNPEGLQQIMKRGNFKAESLLVIDDRLLTGILASLIVGARSKWVRQPLINLKKRPITESFFIFLRFLERQMCR
jgi:putative phosphatase